MCDTEEELEFAIKKENLIDEIELECCQLLSIKKANKGKLSKELSDRLIALTNEHICLINNLEICIKCKTFQENINNHTCKNDLH